jgi:SHS2 domain-containing protein
VPRAFFDHTGDVGVSLHAATVSELFREGALALTETITELAQVRAESPHRIEIAAAGLDDLLVDWLGELLYRFEVQNLLVARADVEVQQTPAGWSLGATAWGEPFDQARHHIKVLVKGITYHRLRVSEEADRWHTDVVFDI